MVVPVVAACAAVAANCAVSAAIAQELEENEDYRVPSWGDSAVKMADEEKDSCKKQGKERR